MSLPSITVILCTHNRQRYLDKVLDSLCNQTLPEKAYDIIVVDNGSTDATKEVILRKQQEKSQSIRYIYEPVLGVAQARNSGAQAATGEIFAYIDDDALAEPDWLEKLAAALTGAPDVVCVAGKIDLLWEAPRPSWMPDELEGYLGGNTRWGDTPKELPPDKAPHEGNMAIWRWAIQKAGGFDTHFGRVGSSLGTNEGPRLTDQLRKLGKVMYAPDALVHHCVPVRRTKKKFFYHLGLSQGAANADLAFLRNRRSRAGLLRSFLADILFLLRETGAMLYAWLRRDQQKTFANLVYLTIRLGQMHQTLRLVFRRRAAL